MTDEPFETRAPQDELSITGIECFAQIVDPRPVPGPGLVQEAWFYVVA